MPKRVAPALVLLIAALLPIACGGDDPEPGPSAPNDGHPVLAGLPEAVIDASGVADSRLPGPIATRVRGAAKAAASVEPTGSITIDYPLDESIFPPEFVPPTFLWHDAVGEADTWLVEILPADESKGRLSVLVPGAPRPRGTIDKEAIFEDTSLYEGTEYQNSAVSWTPSGSLWAELMARSAEAQAKITFTGFASSDLDRPLSRGSVRIVTSKDPVGAPIFYRDVPLRAFKGKHGNIQPLGAKAVPLIAWRLRDVSKQQPKLVLKGMPSCGNCHSFSSDGKTLGMDVDGPDGDKGMYAIKPVSRKMVVKRDDVITWNSFADKPKGHKTIGFMSRISPDGRYVATTVNESLFVQNFMQFEFLQVFYPTRGILAIYDRETEEMRALPGADDTDYVQCSPAWSPDGAEIVFSRAAAFEPFTKGMVLPTRPMDPNEPKIRYDLYRIPFNGGKGGKAVPVEGASNNGMSNTFPKVSPDGSWIVYTKCGNGLLMRPDSRLWIVPFEGGEAREMRCNTRLMNSWHSFSPNGRWLVFSSKSNTPYTQALLTHIDEDGNDSPAILIPNCTADNRAVNLPEFLNAPYESMDTIEVPVVAHHAYTLIAQRLMAEGKYEEVAAALEKALEVDPTFPRALNNLGNVYLKLGRVERALPVLERALELDSRDLTVLSNLGVAYLEAGRPHLALRNLNRLLALSPGFPDTAEHVKTARVRIAQLAEETRKCRRALDREPENGQLHWRLSSLCQSAGRLEEAVSSLDQAMKYLPDDPRPVANLAWMLAANADASVRDGARAVRLAEQAVSMTDGEMPEALEVLAAALAEAEWFGAAVRTAERALSLSKKVRPEGVWRIEEHLELYRAGRPVRDTADR